MLAKRILERCRPDMVADTVLDVDLDALRARGVEALLLDLDNTLVQWRSREVREEIAAWVRHALESGFRLAIVSNAGSTGRVAVVAQVLGIPFIVRAVKPRRRGLHRAAALLGVPPERAAVIGDQVFTDVLGGNRAGMTTVLVSPMNLAREFISTRCMRVIERAIRHHTHGHLAAPAVEAAPKEE